MISKLSSNESRLKINILSGDFLFEATTSSVTVDLATKKHPLRVLRFMRFSRSLCKVVGEVIQSQGSHATLDRLFVSSGAPGDPPELAHSAKWKEWLYRIGEEPSIDSLQVLGRILEEFMDTPPAVGGLQYDDWQEKRSRVEQVLEENGLRYFHFGQVLPQGTNPNRHSRGAANPDTQFPMKPTRIEELLEVIIRGLRRAMHPLTHRRKGVQVLSFENEYDVQDLLHSMMRPWIHDIRPEEYTPSYAGSSTRMDFLLPQHRIVIETKIIRDRVHAKKVGDELIIDIEHYRRHQSCDFLWCVVYDPRDLITNAEGFKSDLQGERSFSDGSVMVSVYIL